MIGISYSFSPLSAIVHLALAVRCSHVTLLVGQANLHLSLSFVYSVGTLSRLLPPSKSLSWTQDMGRLPHSIRDEQYPRPAPILSPGISPQVRASLAFSPGRASIY